MISDDDQSIDDAGSIDEGIEYYDKSESEDEGASDQETTSKKGKPDKSGVDATEANEEDLDDLITEHVNYERAPKVTKVLRKYIDKDKRATIDKLTEYESSAVISTLATMIAKYGTNMILVDNYEDYNCPIKIAKLMVNQGKCPLWIKRKVGQKISVDGILTEYYEKWQVNEMKKPMLFKE